MMTLHFVNSYWYTEDKSNVNWRKSTICHILETAIYKFEQNTTQSKMVATRQKVIP